MDHVRRSWGSPVFAAPLAFAQTLPSPVLQKAGNDYLMVAWSGSGASYIQWAEDPALGTTTQGASGGTAVISGLKTGTTYSVRLAGANETYGAWVKMTTGGTPVKVAPDPKLAEAQTGALRFTWTNPYAD